MSSLRSHLAAVRFSVRKPRAVRKFCGDMMTLQQANSGASFDWEIESASLLRHQPPPRLPTVAAVVAPAGSLMWSIAKGNAGKLPRTSVNQRHPRRLQANLQVVQPRRPPRRIFAAVKVRPQLDRPLAANVRSQGFAEWPVVIVPLPHATLM